MLISNFLSTKFSSFSCTYWHILADSKTGAYPAAYHGGCPLVDTLRILGLLCVAIPLLPRLYRIQMYLHLHLHLLGIATHRIALGQQWDASCSGNWKTVNRLKVALLIFPVQKESDSKGGGGVAVRGGPAVVVNFAACLRCAFGGHFQFTDAVIAGRQMWVKCVHVGASVCVAHVWAIHWKKKRE